VSTPNLFNFVLEPLSTNPFFSLRLLTLLVIQLFVFHSSLHYSNNNKKTLIQGKKKMKFNIITNTATFLSCIMVLSVSSTPIPVNVNKRDTIDPSLVPQFGVQPGVNHTGIGDCDGIQGPNGQVVKIPCSCPPNRNTFIQVNLFVFFSTHSY
jgi:hypothetical protein